MRINRIFLAFLLESYSKIDLFIKGWDKRVLAIECTSFNFNFTEEVCEKLLYGNPYWSLVASTKAALEILFKVELTILPSTTAFHRRSHLLYTVTKAVLRTPSKWHHEKEISHQHRVKFSIVTLERVLERDYNDLSL